MEEGYYNGVIGGVRPVKMRYNKENIPGFELEFKVGVFGNDGKPLATVEVYEEFSGKYGLGNMATMTRAQIALEDLRKLGYTHGQDLSQLNTLINKPCRIRVQTKDKNGEVFTNGPRIYFSFNEVKPLEGDVNALLNSIMAGVSAAPAPAPSAPAAAPGGFNFGGTAPAPSAPAAAPAPAAVAPAFPGFPA